jgi:predicted O-methyltransferase YrrM
MHISSKKKIVILGMMTRMPVAGNAWLVGQYLAGFRRLGFDAYYVEAHGIQPAGMLLANGVGDSSEQAASYIARIMKRFGMAHQWAFQALHADGRCYGMSESELARLYRSAELIINLHGGTVPLPEHSATGRLVYLGTDPVQLEIELYENQPATIEFLSQHAAYFTWGLNYGNADCGVPVSAQFELKPTRPPVVPDFWLSAHAQVHRPFTTVGNWRQSQRVLRFQGETYHWSKHWEFLKVLDLPAHSGQEFELALSRSSRTEDDCRLLESHGWRVRDALEFSTDLDAYRDYITTSRAEFTVAKDQNVRLRSGWFSERSAQYLASGRPVITQDTGFGNVLPTGCGLFAFSDMEGALTAVQAVTTAYARHSRAAAEIARDYFHYDVVLRDLLSEFGLNPRRWQRGVAARATRPGAAEWGTRLSALFGTQPEESGHPHVPEEKAHLFSALDNGSTEFEVLNLLHALILTFKPEVALETGTYRGFGAIALASAMAANGVGRLHTVELDPDNAEEARANIDRFDPGLWERLELHQEDSCRFIDAYEGPPFHFAFFDSDMSQRHHEFEALMDRDLLMPGAICIFHDTSRHRSRYWKHDGAELRQAVEGYLDRYGGLVSDLSRGLTIFQLPFDRATVPRQTADSTSEVMTNGAPRQGPLSPGDCRIQIRADVPVEAVVSEEIRLDCTVRNLADVCLLSAQPHPVCLSYRWLDPDGDWFHGVEGTRTILPGALEPQSELTCALRVTAPPTEGQFAIRLTLVQEHVRWFDEVDEANAWTAWVQVLPALDGLAHNESANGNGEPALASVAESAVDC